VELLGLDRVGVLDNLFELGTTSLIAIRAVTRLREREQLAVGVTKIFQYPTVRSLAAHIEGTSSGAAIKRSVRRPSETVRPHEPIAIVGMGGRFPSAKNIDELWELLREGREGITHFSTEELDPSVPALLREDPRYVAARSIIESPELFDASFFGVTPKEALLMDPQQRLLFEVAWETLESSGYVPEKFDGTIGVFAGKYNNTYYSERVVRRPDLIEELGAFQVMVGNEKDYVATRVAHRLDLTGPALSVHTACSTSLVAIAQAVLALRAGQCDMALAGGASLTIPINSGHLYQEGSMLSSDGSTRTFDAQATGTVFGDGVSMVLLKRLSDAVRDGDTISAVIRGVGVNNDGGNKASFTAPSVEGQAAVIAMARRKMRRDTDYQ
jgi:acyl transferase domain-containing protein